MAQVDLGCLNGVRALAILSIIVFHAYMQWNFLLGDGITIELENEHAFIRYAVVRSLEFCRLRFDLEKPLHSL